MENIAARIKELIQSKGLTNKQFAEELDINPSIVSHILSGRNKVSLQVIEGIKKRYTNVNLDYLLIGSGELFGEITNVNLDTSTPKVADSTEEVKIESETPESREIKTVDSSSAVKQQARQNEPLPHSTVSNAKTSKQDQSAEIERIVVFYSDGTFRNYISND